MKFNILEPLADKMVQQDPHYTPDFWPKRVIM